MDATPDAARSMLVSIVAVATGGALGSVLRYLVGLATHRVFPGTVGAGAVFPLGTMVANLIGCFAIGLLAAYFDQRGALSPGVRLGLQVGVLGGFTTFSSFALETLALGRHDEVALALLNVGVQVVFGLAACWLGYLLAVRMIGTVPAG